MDSKRPILVEVGDPGYKSNITVSLSQYDRGLLEEIARALRVIETDIAGHLRPQPIQDYDLEPGHIEITEIKSLDEHIRDAVNERIKEYKQNAT